MQQQLLQQQLLQRLALLQLKPCLSVCWSSKLLAASSNCLPGGSHSSISRSELPRSELPRHHHCLPATGATCFLPSILRFGLAGGLAWLGVLAVGTLGEQVKTRMEVAAEKDNTRDVSDVKVVTLPSGVTYQELRVGGGQQPIKGYLVVVDYM